jgi:AcrR family transcriptional regulator
MTRRDLRPSQRPEPGERRAAILAAAEQVFGELGYAQATVAAIAAVAESSEPLLYRYFAGGKDQMYAEVTRRALDDLRDSRMAAVAALPVGTSTRDRIRAALTAHLDSVARSPKARTQPLRHPGNEPPEVAAIIADS